MTGITFLKAQILSRSSKKWFDITPVAGTIIQDLIRIINFEEDNRTLDEMGR